MPDAVEVQALGQLKTQIQTFTLTNLVSDSVDIFRLNWEDIFKQRGLTVRYTDQWINAENDGTNERDMIGYPMHVFYVQGQTDDMDNETKAIYALRQELQRYYHNKRRMSAVTDTGVNEILTMVRDGPRPPREFTDRDMNVFSWTVIAWFLEPRTA